tara:strand:- start:6176 stop:8704 length:2529 start_codon:yes stop_codon:yes gene_type:complete
MATGDSKYNDIPRSFGLGSSGMFGGDYDSVGEGISIEDIMQSIDRYKDYDFGDAAPFGSKLLSYGIGGEDRFPERDEFALEKAAYQIEMAGSVDPVILAGVDSMNTRWGPGLTVQQILSIVDENPAIAVGFDIGLESLEDADAMYNAPTFNRAYGELDALFEGSGIDPKGLAFDSDFLTEFADVLFDGAEAAGDQLTVEGDVVNTSMAETIIEAHKHNQELKELDEQARIQAATTGQVSPVTAQKIDQTARKFKEFESEAKLFRQWKDLGPQGFENYITNQQNYTPETGMTPTTVTEFLREYGNYDISGAEPLKIAHAAFLDDWAPSAGFKNDPSWVPPYWMADESIMTSHNEELKRKGLLPKDTGTITTGDDLYEDVTRIAFGKGGGIPIPNITSGGKFFSFRTDRGDEFRDFVGGVNPETLRMWNAGMGTGVLPKDAQGNELGDYDRFGNPVFQIPEGLSDEERDYLMSQNQAILDMKKLYKQQFMGTPEDDPMFGVDPGYMGDDAAIRASGREGRTYIDSETGERKTVGGPESFGLDYGRRRSGFPAITPTAPRIPASAIDPETGEPIVGAGTAGTVGTVGQVGTGTGQMGTGQMGTGQMGTGQMGTGAGIGTVGQGASFEDFAGVMTQEQLNQAIANAVGQDPMTYFTPRQQFRQIAQQATGPTSPLRSALWNVENPLMQQYYLSGYGAMPSYGGAGSPRAFADFVSGYGQGQMIDQDSLRGLASEAARIGSLGEQDYADIIYNPELTREQDIRTRLLRSTYGTGEQAAENRLNLARFLSLQRPGGGTYGGAIGQALGRTVDELQSAYQARRPVGVDGQDFLSFYLQQTNPNAPVSGV